MVPLLVLLLVRGGLAQSGPLSWAPALPLSDNCFCQLAGHIDDCSCQVDTVDGFNNRKIHPRLQSLLSKDYFRYFQYQPSRPCPFWDPVAEGGKCTSSYCAVKNCPPTDLPPGLSGQIAEHGHTQVIENKYLAAAQEVRTKECGDAGSLDQSVDSTISQAATEGFAAWKRHDDAASDFCDLDDSNCEDCVHVDLTLNPERYTGYSGEASRRIWRSVYEENCFSPPGGTTRGPFSSAFLPDKLNSLCLEKRAFYRAVSGLHTSITIHLAANYPIKDPAAPFLKNSVEWGPNLELFHQRFDPERTAGQGPYWLKNLYFVYLLELRALAKAAPFLAAQSYFTGREEDKETVTAVRELLDLVKTFPDHFDETSMFIGGQDAKEVKAEFREHFRNITRVMDCVSCDKCKLWGKLQITGLGTALKILFSGDFDAPAALSDGLPVVQGNLKLSRNEIVALFNGFGRISTSILQLERFRDMIRHR